MRCTGTHHCTEHYTTHHNTAQHTTPYNTAAQANLVRIFRDSGFFGTEAVEVEGQRVRPIALTSRLLFDQWRLGEDEADLTVMQVLMQGRKDGRRISYDYYLLDRYDAASHTTSMARTTGYTCSIVARQVASGMFVRRGICPPEFLGAVPECYQHLMRELEKRQIHVEQVVTEAGEPEGTRQVSVFQRQIA